MKSQAQLEAKKSDGQSAALNSETTVINCDQHRTQPTVLSAAELLAVAGGPEGEVTSGV